MVGLYWDCRSHPEQRGERGKRGGRSHDQVIEGRVGWGNYPRQDDNRCCEYHQHDDTQREPPLCPADHQLEHITAVLIRNPYHESGNRPHHTQFVPGGLLNRDHRGLGTIDPSWYGRSTKHAVQVLEFGDRVKYLAAMSAEPFAIQVCQRFLAGETVAAIQQDLGIPTERIEMRIRAAMNFWLNQAPQHETDCSLKSDLS